ncbi:hypothetical protein ACT4JS_000838, partial [Vibrio cholerae]
AAYLQLQVVWVYDLPLQVKMRFKMALRYLTDTQQETTCCLNHFQKFFDNPTLNRRATCLGQRIAPKKEADLCDQPLSINCLVTLS